ncbi:DUF3168 domain-containing protein [Cupriavidus gilardii]|uniref:DUF3168 domain-containing protein n=1 Tax=Cupriavidus gilardii TaxID=82541 RepID=A0ABY4VU74_9BURK|nr:DUF3168 domain-containing protein [Cupriavidus gilardii]USE78908.1 DUF3168 domain-containing protein [Cupriavidus gilardii]
MTVEGELKRALDGLVGGRVYPDTAPDGVQLPFIVYQQVGGTPLEFLAGVPDKRNGRFQIEVWASRRAEASGLIRQVEDIVRTDPVLLGTTLAGALATYDDVLNWYGAQQDFSIWF